MAAQLGQSANITRRSAELRRESLLTKLVILSEKGQFCPKQFSVLAPPLRSISGRKVLTNGRRPLIDLAYLATIHLPLCPRSKKRLRFLLFNRELISDDSNDTQVKREQCT